MHKDLIDCIATAQLARDGVLKKELTVKEANAVAANNHTIIGAYSFDLRERMFLSEIVSLDQKSHALIRARSGDVCTK